MNLAELAIDMTMRGKQAFCKFLSPNDSGETGGHQAGFLISKSAKNMLFNDKDLEDHIAKKNIKVKWHDDFYTDATFTWYESKNELRITRFTKGFPFKGAEYTGALFILIKISDDEFEGYILNSEEEIEMYLSAFGLTPAETNRIVDLKTTNPSIRERRAIDAFISGLNVDFPTSIEMSAATRSIAFESMRNRNAVTNPDKALLEWTDIEYRLFRALEQERYGSIVEKGFSSVDDFVILANQVLNRRKSRAGKSLEHHLAAIFDENKVQYSAQCVTEGNKRPDFIFPSEEAYHDFSFPVNRLTVLAAKTTCKDRWRQILNEADRLRDGRKYLCTLQQGISGKQMDEMDAEKVTLVVPAQYISTFPREKQDRVWTIKTFVNYVKELQRV